MPNPSYSVPKCYCACYFLIPSLLQLGPSLEPCRICQFSGHSVTSSSTDSSNLSVFLWPFLFSCHNFYLLFSDHALAVTWLVYHAGVHPSIENQNKAIFSKVDYGMHIFITMCNFTNTENWYLEAVLFL